MTQWAHEGFEVDDDEGRLDVEAITRSLADSYWAAGIPLETVRQACGNSLCFGLYAVGGEQIGFARVISDYTTFAWLGDVYVLDSHRGRGLGKWMMRCVMEHPRLQGLRRFMLATRDAHTLYEPLGFAPLGTPAKFMEIARPGLYLERRR